MKDLTKIKAIAEIISGMPRHEWEKIAHAINKKYAEESNKVVLDDSSAIEQAILMEI